MSRIRIRVVDGDGAVHRINNHSGDRLTVQVTDPNGLAVNGALVSFTLPESGPSGQFASGLRTDVATTDAEGKATSDSVNWNSHSGGFQVKIMAAKDQVQTGMLSSQYLAEFGAPSSSAVPMLIKPAALTATASTATTASPAPLPVPVAPANTAPGLTAIASANPSPDPITRSPIAPASDSARPQLDLPGVKSHTSHKRLTFVLLGVAAAGGGALAQLAKRSPGAPAIPAQLPAIIGNPSISIGAHP